MEFHGPTANLYYEPSGRFPLAAAGFSLLVVFTGIILATAYAYLSFFVVCYLHILVTTVVRPVLALAFGALLGGATYVGLRWGRARNRSAATFVAALIATSMFHVSWVIWVHALLRHYQVSVSLVALFGDPGLVLDSVFRVSETRAWHPLARTGPVIWTAWGIEALLIFFPAIRLPRDMLDTPFCERCNVWCETDYAVARIQPQPTDELKCSIESKEWRFLESAGSGAADGEYEEYFSLDLCSCPRCDATHYISVRSVYEWTASGEYPESSEQELIRHVLIDTEGAKRVRALATRS